MDDAQPAGTLYIVSTPIGHLGDLSPRAVRTLQDVALILAEDTRHSRHLLTHFAIATPLASYHEHSEARMTPKLVARLVAGESMALISDAGTPLLSDPGARLVAAAIEAHLSVVPIPGSSALLAALVVSGLPTEPFTFLGFLPRKGRERAEALREISAAPHTIVLYEAPGRVAATLADLVAAGAAERPTAVARELTKQFEEVRRGTLGELARYYESTPPRGEVVLVVGAAPPTVLDETSLREHARTLHAQGLSTRDVARTLIDHHGAPRNLAYRLATLTDES